MLALRLSFALSCACAAGCFSTSIGQTPSTVPTGHLRAGIGLSVQNGGDNGEIIHEVSLRAGAHDRIDVGAKFSPTFVEGGVKGQLLRGDFDLSIAGSAGIARDPDDDNLFDEGNSDEYDSMPHGRVMLLAGQRLTSGVELVAIAHGIGAHRSGSSGDPATRWSARMLGAGGGLGVLLGSGSAQFMIEGVATHLIEGHGDHSLPEGATLLQVGVTGMFGGADERDARPD